MTDAAASRYARSGDKQSSRSDPAHGGALAAIVAVWAVLIAASLIQDLLDLNAETRVWILDVNMERSVYTWFSQSLLAGAAVLLANIGMAERRRLSDLAVPFLVLAFLVFSMSADESVSLHEKLSQAITSAYHPTGFLTYVWVVPVGALCLVLLVAFLPFLRRLEAGTRNRMLFAAAVFVIGAIGFEMIESKMISAPGATENDYGYRLLTVIEEALEGLGVILLISALLDYRRRHRIVL